MAFAALSRTLALPTWRPFLSRWQAVWLGYLAILAICFLLDEPVYRVVHAHYNAYIRPIPPSLRLMTRVLRSLENWGEDLYIAAVLVAIWQLDRSRRSRVLGIVLAAAMVSLSAEGAKRLFGRSRPDQAGGRTVFHGPKGASAGGEQSFPSGHVAAAAAYSGILSAYYPPCRGVAIVFAVGCGASRIWKERHFLSDCWAGGAAAFYFAYLLPRRRWFQRLALAFDRRFSVPAPA